MRWPPSGHDRQRELFSDDAEPCEPGKTLLPESRENLPRTIYTIP